MKYFEKFYVGFQKNRYSKSDPTRMLGFATYITNDNAYEKRKSSVDKWRDKTIDPIVIDNTPTTGFKIVETVERYSTSNKLFRIRDPRGFELEISAENLFDVITNYTIVKGEIIEPLVWAREKGNNYLISSNSAWYVEEQKPKIEVKQVPGMYFKNKPGNVIYRYEGLFFGNSITKQENGQRKLYSWERPLNDKITVTFQQNNYNLSKFYVYTEFRISSAEDIEYGAKKIIGKEILIRRSLLKDLEVMDESTVFDEIKSFKFKTGEYYFRNFRNLKNEITFTSNLTSWPDLFVFFDNREEAKKYEFSLGFLKEKFYTSEQLSGVAWKNAEFSLTKIV